MRHPREYIRRKMLARWLCRNIVPMVRIDEHDGYCVFDVRTLPFGEEALNLCRWFYNERRNTNIPGTRQIEGKPWRKNLLSPSDFQEHPELLKFACSNEVMAVVSSYLKTVPEIGNIQLWLTQINNATESSQLFHIDQEDFRQAKMFVHVSNVDDGSGPFTLVRAAATRVIEQNAIDPYTRVSDGEALTYCTLKDIVPLIGPPGTAAFVDTSRCYHYGSRTRGNERAVLVITYIPYHHIMEPTHSLLERKNIPQTNLPEFAKWALPT